MHARLLMLALALASAGCTDAPPAQPRPPAVSALMHADPRIKLPTASEAIPHDDDPTVRVVINLDANGATSVANKQVTLLELGKILRAEKIALRESQPDARMQMLLRVDGEAPWRHVNWLMTVCANGGRYSQEARIRIAARRANGTEGFLVVWLPLDNDPPRASVKMTIKGTKAEPISFGPAGSQVQVLRPTGATFKFGKISAPDLATIRERVAVVRAYEQKHDRNLEWWLRASSRVPYRFVVAALNVYAAEGIGPWVYIYGTTVPNDREKRAAFLLYPRARREAHD